MKHTYLIYKRWIQILYSLRYVTVPINTVPCIIMVDSLNYASPSFHLLNRNHTKKKKRGKYNNTQYNHYTHIHQTYQQLHYSILWVQDSHIFKEHQITSIFSAREATSSTNQIQNGERKCLDNARSRMKIVHYVSQKYLTLRELFIWKKNIADV